MRAPNFFIVGAPKCGTTSLAAWLSGHPCVYMPSLKEPAFFSTDLPVVRPALLEYAELFSAATDAHLAVGEASTAYLFSRVAVPRIVRHLATPRLIVCLRNPIDMVTSLHRQEVFTLNEDVRDFDDAWRLQESRRAGRRIPRTCRSPWLLHYRERCLLGEQVERLLRELPRHRVLFVFLEDVSRDPREQYLRVLRFLGVPDDGRRDFPALNRRKDTKSRLLKETVIRLSERKQALGLRHPIGVRSTLERWNTCRARHQELSAETRRELRDSFADDVLRLGALLRRDLTAWLA